MTQTTDTFNSPRAVSHVDHLLMKFIMSADHGCTFTLICRLDWVEMRASDAFSVIYHNSF